ncbi:Type I Iterative PKS [Microsporum audouinii]
MGDAGTSLANGVHDDALPQTIPIAIVGMGCRFGGGITNPEELWQMVADGKSAWSPIPQDRFNREAFFHPDSQRLGTSDVKGGCFLQEDVGLFDTSFFGLTAEVAASMDPQIRLLLEVTYEALESAGLTLAQIAGSNTSVFTGSFIRDYHDMLSRDPTTFPRYFTTGNFMAMMANRISHYFDLRGPSTPVDTGCSTSMTALHLACQTLRTGEADAAIVGETCIMLNPDMFCQLSSLGFIGPEGRCFAFDHRAQGYGRGEGIATLVLKRLDEALRDGDPIRAVIRETGMNQDGKTPTITSPSRDAQEALMRACYQRAGLNPDDTTYVEAHGTGTKAGDPVEVAAIRSVFGAGRTPQRPLVMGSVKSNLGHTEAASGLAAIIKVVKALENRQIPPTINIEQFNGKLGLQDGVLHVAQDLEAWPETNIRRASVNNFGYGGSNTHVIMEDAANHVLKHSDQRSAAISQGARPSRKVFILSGKDEGPTKRLKDRLLRHIQEHDLSLPELAYTLSQRRSRFPYTVAFSAASTEELSTKLADQALRPIYAAGTPRLGFVFTGQGAQWHAMGRELIEKYPVFRQALHDAEKIFREFGSPWSCIEELSRDLSTTHVNKPSLSFPLSCLIQLALVRLLASWGIRPAAVTGHSSGEVAAAYTSGALSFREALAIVYFRGLLTSEHIAKTTSPGGMLAVGLGQRDIQNYLDRLTTGTIVVACVNSPSSVTLSGDLAGIEEVQRHLDDAGIFAHRLRIESAYHSHHMLPLQQRYRELLATHLGPTRQFDPDVVFSSPVSGGVVHNADTLGPEHWVRNMIQPVLFDQSLENMCFENGSSDTPVSRVDMIIEIGPHGALAGPIRQCLTAASPITYTSCLTRNQDAVETLQSMVSTLVSHGKSVDLAQVNFPNGEDKELRAIPDLPSYAWNHSQRYWAEPRISREHRLREHPTHELLGNRMPGLSSNFALFRLILRPGDMPWVRDHLVQTEMVYPGAGCLAMAIEGMRRISVSESSPLPQIRGYRLRHVEITRALIIPDTADGVEVQLLLQPPTSRLAPNWREFHISSANTDGDWVEHCHGLVGVDTEEPPSDQDPTNRLPSTARIQLNSTDGTYFRSIEPADVFHTLRKAGVHHGPLFQNLSSVRAGFNKAVASFSSVDSAAIQSTSSDHIIHPITLDSVFQAVYAALSKDAQREMGAAIPRSIKEMYVSEAISRESNHAFEAFVNLDQQSARGFSVSIALADQDQQHGCLLAPVLEIDGMHFQRVGGASDDAVPSDHPRGEPLCLTMDWKESIALNDPAIVRQRLSREADAGSKAMEADLTRATYHIVRQVSTALTDGDVATIESRYPELLQWMGGLEDRAAKNQLGPRSARWATSSEGVRQMLLDRVATQSANGQLLTALGRNMLAILRGQMDPLQTSSVLDTFLEKMLHKPAAVKQLARVIDLYAHQNPRAKILEVGTRSPGECVETIMQYLTKGSAGLPFARVGEYTVTGHRASDDAASDKFSAWAPLVRYQTLDLAEDPTAQGFENGSYDIVIASLLSHESTDLRAAVGNARRLLKEGGKLLVIERVRETVDTRLLFGLLSQHWNPPRSMAEWERTLCEMGFSGVDFEIPDCEEEEERCFSVIVSTAAAATVDEPETLGSKSNSISVVYTDSPPPEEWTDGLMTALSDLTDSTVIVEPLHGLDSREKVIVFVAEIAVPFLRQMNEQDFTALKAMLTQSKHVAWLSRGADINSDIPDQALHTGMLRTCRTEDSSKRYISIDLDPAEEPWAMSSISAIGRVLQAIFMRSLPDSEFAVRDGALLVPRVQFDSEASKAVAPSTDAELQPFYQLGRDFRLFIETPGLLDSLVFKDDPEAQDPLPEGYVEIEPRAFGLNFRDVMVAMGQMEEPQMGFECAGIVKRAQGTATGHFKAGDRVCAITAHGHWANLTRVPWTSAARIPDEMDFEMAASIPMAFVTAYYSLFEAARLEAGETVLIHAASGGVGQAAIILAQWKQAKIFATVGSPEKRRFLMDTYQIPASQIFSSRDPSFARGVKAATGGKGVDIVLNSLAGELLDETWHCLAPYGRFVEIGKKDIQSNKQLEMRPFQDAVTFASFDLVQLSDYRGPVLFRILGDVVSLFEQKAVRALSPITTYPISDLGRAFRQMQAGRHIGKIVMVPRPGDKVKVCTGPRPVRLPPDVTYLITGGLGGIGRSIARWMVERGAKHLILVSRNSASRPESQELIKELGHAGCEAVAVNCDVSQPMNLGQVLFECQETMPPIRGVIQAAMNLQDSILEQMSFTQWSSSIAAKVQATRNLHEYFGDRLSFFIMLSSVVGVVGNASQANYGAGGSYQDALARHRVAQGLPGVALDLGMVQSVGWLAQNKAVGDRLLREGHRPLREEEVLQLVASAIQNPVRGPGTSQVITGIAGFTPDAAASGWRSDPRFTGLQLRPGAAHAAGLVTPATSLSSLKQTLAEATATEQPVAPLITHAVIGKLSEMFATPVSEIDPSMPLSHYGVDSLVAVELRNWMVAQSGCEMSIFDVMGSASLSALADKIADRLNHRGTRCNI